MQREADYHKDAMIYNEMMASHARIIMGVVRNRKIKSWCETAIERHEFHAERHRKTLNDLNNTAEKAEEPSEMSSEKPIEESTAVDPTTQSPEPDLEVSGTTESDVETTSSGATEAKSDVLGDGCSPFHNPSTNPNCDFSPKAKETTNA